MLVSISGISYTQMPKVKFKFLTMEDGLSQSQVNCIVQDKTGFIWIGTGDGLNRYDGSNIVVYRHEIDDSTVKFKVRRSSSSSAPFVAIMSYREKVYESQLDKPSDVEDE